MSLGLNIKAFLTFVSNRFIMINSSQKRQTHLLHSMLEEHQKLQSQSVKESTKLKSTIQSLKNELA